MTALLVSIGGGLVGIVGFLIKWLLEKNKTAAANAEIEKHKAAADVLRNELIATQGNLQNITSDLKDSEKEAAISIGARDKALLELRRQAENERAERDKNATPDEVLERLRRLQPPTKKE